MSEVRGMEARQKTDNVTITTTSETNVIGTTLKAVEKPRARFRVLGHVQLTTGAGTTAVTLRLRRGIGTGGDVIGEANAITIGATAGDTEAFSIMAVDAQEDKAEVSYSLTVEQADASGDGTALFSSIDIVEY